MRIRFVRGTKQDVLTCVRDDGTTTWMHERPGFVVHDLAHYAVETGFGYASGFFGLVAHGWELSSADFGRDPATKERYPWPGGEQEPVEYVVSLFQRGREVGVGTADEIREALRLYWGHVPAVFTDDRIERVKRGLADLERRWAAVPQGGSLELEFLVPPEPPADRAGRTGARPGGAHLPRAASAR